MDNLTDLSDVQLRILIENQLAAQSRAKHELSAAKEGLLESLGEFHRRLHSVLVPAPPMETTDG